VESAAPRSFDLHLFDCLDSIGSHILKPSRASRKCCLNDFFVLTSAPGERTPRRFRRTGVRFAFVWNGVGRSTIRHLCCSWWEGRPRRLQLNTTRAATVFQLPQCVAEGRESPLPRHSDARWRSTLGTRTWRRGSRLTTRRSGPRSTGTAYLDPDSRPW